jgi:hypothetical protein
MDQYDVQGYCLGFKNETNKKSSGADVTTLLAQPDIKFRPIGLMLFGTTKETKVIELQVINVKCITASSEPVPGYFFESGYSFEDFKWFFTNPISQFDIMFQRWMKTYPDVSKRMLMDGMPTMDPWHRCVLNMRGPFDHAVLWGHGFVLNYTKEIVNEHHSKRL